MKRAQAILELGLFGSIILAIVITLVSYQQRLNDQQYLTMKTFRDALLTAQYNTATTQIPDPNNPNRKITVELSKGGNVVMNEIEHRRHPAGDFFTKGQRAVISSSAHVYWGVPAIDAEDYEEGGTEGVRFKVYDLQHFQLYKINTTEKDLAGYYDKDNDGIPDYEDDDIDGDGIPNNEDDDANGDGIDDEYAANHSGMYDDMDGDGIPNWQDKETQDPDIQLVMNYKESSTQKRHIYQWNTYSSTSYDLTLQDIIEVKFVDKNTQEVLDSFDQYLTCDPISWKCSYIESPDTVEKVIEWDNSSY